jgi:hypothetical protein
MNKYASELRADELGTNSYIFLSLKLSETNFEKILSFALTKILLHKFFYSMLSHYHFNYFFTSMCEVGF